MSRPLTIKLIFVVHAILAGAFLTRVADIQLALGLGDAALGTVLMAQPLGVLATLPFSSWLVERFGAKPVMRAAMLLMCAMLAAIAVAPNVVLLSASLLVFALGFAMMHVTMNVEADRVEIAEGKKVVSQCHGYWGLGYLAVTMLGVLMRGSGVPSEVHLAGMAVAMALVSVFLMSRFEPSPPRAHSGGEAKRPFFVLPSATVLLLVLFAISGALTEMSARSWSVIYMRDSFTSPEWVQSMSLTIFALTVAGGRLIADRFLDRFDSVGGTRIFLVSGLIGTAIVALTPTPLIALIGFAFMGLGVSITVPLMLTCAARIGDRPSSENVAAASLANSLTMLIAPAAMGFAAEALGIQTAFALLLPMLIVSIAVSGVVRLRDTSGVPA